MEPAGPDPKDEDFEELLDRARGGSQECLGELLERCRAYLQFQSRRLSGGRYNAKNAASDVVQDTFLEAVRDFPQFRGRSRQEFLGWILQVLNHNVRNVRRRYAPGTKRAATEELSLNQPHLLALLKTQLSAHARTPSSEFVHQEEETRAQRMLAELPESYRMVLHLRMVQRLPFKVIAARMGNTPDAMRQLWRRALHRLTAALAETE